MTKTPDMMTDQELADMLANVLTVQPIEQDYYQGPALENWQIGRAYGGLVIAQATMAAMETVEPHKICHSLHAYFMRPGDATAPILYQVERDNDGRSFSTRRVIALQNGRPILNFAASFHAREDGFSHATPMPDMLRVDELPEDSSLIFRFPVETRRTWRRDLTAEDMAAPSYDFWFRVRGDLGSDPRLHLGAIAFASDLGVLTASMKPHGKHYTAPGMQVTSLDHALWLHGDARADEWLLFVTESPWAGAARGFNTGRIYTADGRMIANIAQEGLTRNIGGA